ncbi:MAG TPA: Na+/H+ antiporter NhaC family protein [Gemmatimonadales bacterium]|nr:Na+/H+ antiporter NhaC family protein [Gemmatimonadales bacterium]
MKFPHPLTLLCGCVLLAAAASHVLPPGEYDRRDDPVTSRRVVIAGTYHAVAPHPVGAFQALVAIPRGMANAAPVIFFVFLIGGAFTVVDETGALRQGVDWLVRRFGHSEALVIPAASLAFATGGVLDNMKEEIIALVPAMLLLARRLGYRPTVAVAMSLGAAAVGAAFSPINPFQVGIAQQLAQLPLLSGSLFRIVFLVAALGVWIWGTTRYAVRTRTDPAPATSDAVPVTGTATLDRRRGVVLALVLVSFGALVVGVLRGGWGFNEMAALFFVMGVVAGLAGGLGIGGTAEAFVAGFRSMAYAALLIGFARAIFVTLEQGRIVDTIVHGLFTPLANLPLALAALGMMLVHAVVHVPVPSPSGHAVLTLPILVPLADLLGLSRQVTVLAYQYGGGLCELFTPTNGALMAILAAAQVRYEEWLRFALPLLLGLLALGAGAVGLGVAIGLQ